MRAAAVVLASALAAAATASVPASAAQEDPWTLRLNPMRNGFQNWTRTGPDKAFTWADAEQTLAMKGQSGKEPPRLVHARIAWDRGGMTFQAKKGARKVRVVLVPEAGDAKPIALEFPRDAFGTDGWTDLGMRMTKGKVSLFAPGAEGAEREVATAPLPEDGRWRFGFEAPSGTDAVIGMIRFQRAYEEEPQFCEPDFQPLFDGANLAPWVPQRETGGAEFRAERGVLVGEPRVSEVGWIAAAGGAWTAYELRMNALWGTSALDVRAYEVPGKDGQINRFASVHVNFTDHLDPEGVSALAVRVADGKVVASVNGKVILDSALKHPDPTPLSLFIQRGKRCALRDIRIKDLAPGAGSRAPTLPEAPGAKPDEAPKPATWSGKGGAAEKDGVWTVDEAGDETGIVAGASSIGSYELRFRVGKGADGLAIVPRATRGLKRAPGVRLDSSLFAADEWTEVAVKVVLLKATVTVAGKEAGAMDLDHASGAPAIRVDAGGRARLKDLVLEAAR
jgi:hypothetical protein